MDSFNIGPILSVVMRVVLTARRPCVSVPCRPFGSVVRRRSGRSLGRQGCLRRSGPPGALRSRNRTNSARARQQWPTSLRDPFGAAGFRTGRGFCRSTDKTARPEARMRNRVRIQPYISPDLRKRLAASSAAQDVTESAIAEAALAKYLEPDQTNEALIVRRLDSVAQAVGAGRGTAGDRRRDARAVRPVPFKRRAREGSGRTAVTRARGCSGIFWSTFRARSGRDEVLAAVRRAGRATQAAAPALPVEGGGREGSS